MAEIFGYIALGAGWTVLMTFGSAAIGIVLAVPLLALAQSRFAAIRGIYNGFVHVVRGVPTLVWLFIAFFGVGGLGITLNPVTASLLALSMIATAYMAEIYRGGMKAIPAGQWEAAGALNLDRASTLRFVVGPQLFRAVSPSVATQIIGLLKDSALVSTIGVTDLVFRAGIMTQYHAEGLYMFGFAGLIYLLLSLPIAVFSRNIHARITRRYAVA
ncbi:amino acid ABC transporter permease [Saxibacter everestensis]|uniref:Amino acid ABC transporter permease n=1 Tax=Saxibacter everestensis TaxID=2909229 RepID=A0ABY8QWP2_9MICO|nr:amino acid ABC transporter permease [Brevibacteriaceae bacterium ZFBP1038]